MNIVQLKIKEIDEANLGILSAVKSSNKIELSDLEKILKIKIKLKIFSEFIDKDQLLKIEKEIKKIIYSMIEMKDLERFIIVYSEYINYAYQSYESIMLDINLLVNDMYLNLVNKRPDKNINLLANLLSKFGKLRVLFYLN